MPYRAYIGAVVLPVLLAGAGSPTPPGPCEVTGDTSSEDDVALAITACESARARFGELFGEPVPNVRIQLTRDSGYRIGTEEAGAAVLWPTSEAMRPAEDDHVALQWREVLPHEASHALLTARFFADVEIAEDDYGTPLPDWLDEGVAIWAEPEESRAERIAQARGLPAHRRGLEDILTAPHPAMANAAAWRMRDGAAPPSDDEALWAFYPQSIAVLAFVLETGGPEALRGFVERALERPSEVGVSALVGLPGMGEDEAGVVAAWEEWLTLP